MYIKVLLSDVDWKLYITVNCISSGRLCDTFLSITDQNEVNCITVLSTH